MMRITSRFRWILQLILLSLSSTVSSKSTVWRETTACYGADRICSSYELTCDQGKTIVLAELKYGTKWYEPTCQFGVSNCDKQKDQCCFYDKRDIFTDFSVENRSAVVHNCQGRRSCSGWAPRLFKTPFSSYVWIRYACVQERKNIISMCSSKQIQSNEVFLTQPQDYVTSGKNNSVDCSCRVVPTICGASVDATTVDLDFSRPDSKTLNCSNAYMVDSGTRQQFRCLSADNPKAMTRVPISGPGDVVTLRDLFKEDEHDKPSSILVFYNSSSPILVECFPPGVKTSLTISCSTTTTTTTQLQTQSSSIYSTSTRLPSSSSSSSLTHQTSPSPTITTLVPATKSSLMSRVSARSSLAHSSSTPISASVKTSVDSSSFRTSIADSHSTTNKPSGSKLPAVSSSTFRPTSKASASLSFFTYSTHRTQKSSTSGIKNVSTQSSTISAPTSLKSSSAISTGTSVHLSTPSVPSISSDKTPPNGSGSSSISTLSGLGRVTMSTPPHKDNTAITTNLVATKPDQEINNSSHITESTKTAAASTDVGTTVKVIVDTNDINKQHAGRLLALDDGGDNTGLVIGLTVGAIVIVAILVAITLLCLFIRLKRKEKVRRNYIQNTNIFYSFPEDYDDRESTGSDIRYTDVANGSLSANALDYGYGNSANQPATAINPLRLDDYKIKASTSSNLESRLDGVVCEPESDQSSSADCTADMANETLDYINGVENDTEQNRSKTQDKNNGKSVTFDASALYAQVKKEGKTKF